MQMTSIDDKLPKKLEDLTPGDHLCCLYETEEEHRAIVTPFLRQGLERGEKVFYIVDVRSAQSILDYLREERFDVEPYLASGQLTILTREDAYNREGIFDPDGMIALLKAETEQALAEGYSALRVTGEMTWALRGLPGSERLIEYEAKLNDFFPGNQCLAICQYDRRRFAPEVLLDVLRTHPFAIVGKEVYDNFYYIPPDDLLAGNLPAVKLGHWLENLAEHKRAEESARESENRFRMLAESTFEGILIHENAKVVDTNKKFEDMFGYKRSELIGMNAMKLVAPESQELVRSNIRNEYTQPYETVGLRKNGSTFIMEINARMVDHGGKRLRVAACRDISERKRAEEALLESEEKYRNIFNNAQVGIFRTRISDGKVLECNDSFARTHGYETRQECEDDFVASEHYTDPGAREKIMASLMEKGAINDLEVSVSCKDGGNIRFRFSAHVYPEEGYLEGVGYEITEEKRALESLRESEEKFSKFFFSSPTWVAITRLEDGTYLEVNKTFEEITGFERKEVIGRTSLELGLWPEPIGRRQRFITMALEEGGFREQEITFLAKNGEPITALWSADVIELAGQECLLSTVMDISELKRTREEKEKLQAQLQRAQKMEAIGLLAGGVAHDLNNILSGIVSYPDLLLLDVPKDSPIRRPIEVIKESGQRAADVVSDLLTIARGIASEKRGSNLNSLVQEYLSSPEHKRLESMRSSISFETVLEPELLNISCSPVHIKKTLMNLVINASEAIEGIGTVTISTMNRYLDEPLKGYEDVRIGEYAVLSVSDDGTGISHEDLERIFEPFYTKKIMGRIGTGLGLAVVWNTVQDHNGYINVRTSERGTVFELYFSITREEAAAVKEEVEIEDYLGHGEKILVVDDEQRQREIASGMLTRLGYNAESVSSGEEAVEYVKENPVDLIVLDMVMPKGFNGRKTYEEIIKIRPEQKAIIASGFSETEDVKRAQRLGAGKYIKKPYTLEKISLAVKEELGK